MDTQRKSSHRSSFLSRRGRRVGQSLDRRLHFELLEDRRVLDASFTLGADVLTLDNFSDTGNGLTIESVGTDYKFTLSQGTWFDDTNTDTASNVLLINKTIVNGLTDGIQVDDSNDLNGFGVTLGNSDDANLSDLTGPLSMTGIESLEQAFGTTTAVEILMIDAENEDFEIKSLDLSGNFNVETSGDVLVGAIEASGTIVITASAGSINDSTNNATEDLMAGGLITLTARDEIAGVGSDGKLELAAGSEVNASSTLSGVIRLRGLGALTLTDVDTAIGSIDVMANGKITATRVNAQGATADVTLMTTLGGVVVTNVEAGRDVAINADAGDITDGDAASSDSTDIQAGRDVFLTSDLGNIGRVVGIFNDSDFNILEIEAANDLSAIAPFGSIALDASVGGMNTLNANANNTIFLQSSGDIDVASLALNVQNLALVSSGVLTIGGSLSVGNAGDLRLEGYDIIGVGGFIDLTADRLLFKSEQAEMIFAGVNQLDAEVRGNYTVNNARSLTLTDLNLDGHAVIVNGVFDLSVLGSINDAPGTGLFVLGTSTFDAQGDITLGDQAGDIAGFGDLATFNATGTVSTNYVLPFPLVVDTPQDNFDGDISGGNLSLREAIAISNAVGGADNISFDALLSGATIPLQLGEIPITGALTIDGSSLANQVAIDAGNGADNLFGTGDGSRIFDIDDGDNSSEVDVTLRGLTLTGGDVSVGGGGAISSRENLTLTFSTITGNSTDNVGGGIFALSGITTITSSTITGNSADDDGGGIFAYDGATTITSSTITGNSANDDGGGIVALSGITTITSSTITGNLANDDGGGIFSNTNLSSQTTTVTGSTLSGNTASGQGGGIFNFDGLLVIQSSTITDNTAPAGLGSGVASFGDSFTRTEVTGSIIAGNTNEDVAVTNSTSNNSFLSNGFNLISTGGGLLDGLANFTATGDQTGVTSPLLGPLANNGGPTLTHALLTGSSAIDAGDPAIVFSATEFDQRGAPFTRVDSFGSTIDIGAFEFQAVVDSADFDNDNDIDGFDFLAWQRGFGSSSPAQSDGDANNDGNVDGDDLDIWQSQFGQPAPIIAAASAVSGSEALASAAAFESEALSTNLPADLIDIALATEWLGVVAEEETPARATKTVAIEAAFSEGSPVDRLAPAENLLMAFGDLNANAEDAEADTDEPWLAEELLERVFA